MKKAIFGTMGALAGLALIVHGFQQNYEFNGSVVVAADVYKENTKTNIIHVKKYKTKNDTYILVSNVDGDLVSTFIDKNSDGILDKLDEDIKLNMGQGYSFSITSIDEKRRQAIYDFWSKKIDDIKAGRAGDTISAPAEIEYATPRVIKK